MVRLNMIFINFCLIFNYFYYFLFILNPQLHFPMKNIWIIKFILANLTFILFGYDIHFYTIYLIYFL